MQLPKGWQWIKLGGICRTTSGGTPSRRRPDYFLGDIPWVKSGELNDGIIREVEECITEEAEQNSNAKRLPKGTLLIAMYGATVGKLGILGMEATTNQAVCAIFTPKTLERDFLFYFLRSIRGDLIGASVGGAQPNISQTLIREIQIPIPHPDDPRRSLDIQRRIITRIEALLGEVREMYELQADIVRNTDRFIDSVLAEAYAIHTSLPAGWELRKLSEISIINPRRPSITRDDDILTSFVPMQDVDETEGKFNHIQIRPYGEIRRGYTYFEENDVLFAKITPSMENGKTAIARGLIDGFGFGSTEFHVIRPPKSILPEWIHYFIRRTPFRHQAKQHFRGAVGQQRVPAQFLAAYLIPVPFPNNLEKSLEVQRNIVQWIETVNAEVREMQPINRNTNAELEQLEQTILAQAFQGEL